MAPPKEVLEWIAKLYPVHTEQPARIGELPRERTNMSWYGLIVSQDNAVMGSLCLADDETSIVVRKPMYMKANGNEHSDPTRLNVSDVRDVYRVQGNYYRPSMNQGATPGERTRPGTDSTPK